MIWIGLCETESISPIKGDEAVRLAFGNLADEFRLPLWFSLGLSMSRAEISEVLGVPPDRVMNNIQTAGSQFLQACESAGVEADLKSLESLLARMASEPAPASLMGKLEALAQSDRRRFVTNKLFISKDARGHPGARLPGAGTRHRAGRQNSSCLSARNRWYTRPC